jgi:hypothetical protein
VFSDCQCRAKLKLSDAGVKGHIGRSGISPDYGGLDIGAEREYTLTGPDATGFGAKEENAVFSPVRKLPGKETGEKAVADVPGGKIHLEVTGISYRGPFIDEGIIRNNRKVPDGKSI